MKLFTVLAAVLLVAGVAEAREKSTKSVPAIVVDRAGNAVGDILEVPAEIGQFARENDCVHGGSRTQCIYEMPARGLVGVSIAAAGDVVEEGTLLVTEVPVRILDWVADQFQMCSGNGVKVVCNGAAFVFRKSADAVYAVGYFAADTVSDVTDGTVQSIKMSTDSVNHLFAGEFGQAADNAISATLLTAGCMTIGKLGALLLNGEKLDCTEWVAGELEKEKRKNGN